MAFEHKREKLLPNHAFNRRMGMHAAAFAGLICTALAIGTLGYHAFGDLPWVDSLLNATMILTGMGPVDRMQGDGAKLFAAAYALFSGVLFLTSVGVLLAPVLHRFLHRFHLAEDGDEG